jgi:hypothetical protein
MLGFGTQGNPGFLVDADPQTTQPVRLLRYRVQDPGSPGGVF